jgi:uncharacterized membrane protein
MRFEHAVAIAAHADSVWRVIVDVETWPELTESMTSVERVDPGPLTVGSRVKIKQPRLPTTEWVVTECVEGQKFVWESNNAGVRTRAVHSVLEAAGSTTLRLEIEQSGLLSGLVGVLFGAMTHKYLDMEALGFKARAEALAGRQ